ncbi:MAG TPA: L,D-transpeptidase family protein [Solirubrobacteraceae bacterium]|nr:L,D-transpeptidase family protein [Solirubrobacteraceae bacterium]
MLVPAPQPAVSPPSAAVVAPASTPGAGVPGAGASAAPAAPVAGQVRLTLVHAGGSPPFALPGQQIAVRGIVTPYVGGQTVSVGFYRDGHAVRNATVAVTAVGNGTGQFRASYASRYAGLVQARATHAASAQQAAFSARSPNVRYVDPNVAPGDRGPSVRLLQSELDVLRFAVPLSGVFDEGTGRALVAYRKMTGLARIPAAGASVWRLLGHRAGRFHVRYLHDGRHVEADLTRQVLAEIEPGGRVHTIYTISSGKPSTPTVLGRFQVYSKAPGFNSEGMFDSNYFIRGYAIHGYAEVPTYAASHGCLRVPIPDAPAIYSWVRVGTPVDVYYE